MNITMEQLAYAFLVDSGIFAVFALFFFAYSLKTIHRVHDMVKSVIALIERVEARYEDIKHEGTDTD